MPIQGLHPRSRVVSLESEDDLRSLSSGHQSLTRAGDAPCRPLSPAGGHATERSMCLSHTIEELPSKEGVRDLNELLNLNGSIYDLTIFYSCLAAHPLGGKLGLPNLAMVLLLQVVNVFLQMTLLFSVEELIAVPAMTHAQLLYDKFTQVCYGDDASSYSQEVESNFESWTDDFEKGELCRFPMACPTFFFLIILIWTFFLCHEWKQTVYFAWVTLRLEAPTEGFVSILDHNDNFIITHMGTLLKTWTAVTVFLPKFVIASILWFIGARWLTATPGIDNLMLNSLALTFICELDELIFRTVLSEVTKACLEKTKLPLPYFRYTPTIFGIVEIIITCVFCGGLALLYVGKLQTAIPDYRWDLDIVCREFKRTAGLHGLHVAR